MTEGPQHLDLKLADPGATPAALQATETIIGVLHGFTLKLAYSAIMNALAILICNQHDTETRALDEVRQFKREMDRCIRLNHAKFREAQRGRN